MPFYSLEYVEGVFGEIIANHQVINNWLNI